MRRWLPAVPVFRASRTGPWASEPWHATGSDKRAMGWEGPFHSMRRRHAEASGTWRWTSMHHVWWHGPRWHHREALQVRGRHSRRALERDEARPCTEKTGGWGLDSNDGARARSGSRARSNSLSTKKRNRLGYRRGGQIRGCSRWRSRTIHFRTVTRFGISSSPRYQVWDAYWRSVRRRNGYWWSYRRWGSRRKKT